jgi:hypothetical protein
MKAAMAAVAKTVAGKRHVVIQPVSDGIIHDSSDENDCGYTDKVVKQVYSPPS